MNDWFMSEGERKLELYGLSRNELIEVYRQTVGMEAAPQSCTKMIREILSAEFDRSRLRVAV